MDTMQMDGRALQIRQEAENTAFRVDMFKQISALYKERWATPLEDREAHGSIDRKIDEFRLERAQEWVSLFRRQLKEIADDPDAILDAGRIEAIDRGLAFQRSEVVRIARKLESSA